MSYIIGITPSEVWTSTQTPPFKPGQRGSDYLGNEYLFVQADTTNSAPGAQAGGIVCVPQVAIAASGYGWGLVCGVGSVRTNALAAKGTLLNTTATAGQLDDDATAGAEVINGIALTAATGGAAASTVAYLTYPSVGRTL